MYAVASSLTGLARLRPMQRYALTRLSVLPSKRQPNLGYPAQSNPDPNSDTAGSDSLKLGLDLRPQP